MDARQNDARRAPVAAARAPAPRSVPTTPDPDSLRRQIERTRAHMDDTIEELQRRLSPRYMAHQAMGSVRHGGQRTYDSTLDMVREHPVAASVTGAAAALLGGVFVRRRMAHSGSPPPHDTAVRVPVQVYQPAPAVPGGTPAPVASAASPPHVTPRIESPTRGTSQSTMKHATEQAYESTTSTVRDHPIAITLAGGALALLAGALIKRQMDQSSGSRGRPDFRRRRAMQREPGPEAPGVYYGPEEFAIGERELRERETEPGRGTGERMREMGERTSERMSGYTEAAKERLGHAGETMQQYAERAGGSMHHLADRTRQRGREAADYAGGAMHRATDAARHAFDEHPLMVGAAVLGAACAIAMAIPSSRREREWIGPRRDELFGRAKEYGRDMYKRGRTVASSAVGAATEEAHSQHLTPQDVKEQAAGTAQQAMRDPSGTVRDLGERAQRVVESGQEAAKRKAKEQGLTPGQKGKEAAEREGGGGSPRRET